MNKDKKPLSETHPELAKEAHGWDPKTIVAGSAKRLEWKCSQGHLWKTSSSHRSRSKSNCPVCSNQKILSGFNDLATTHPAIAQEAYGWDPKKIGAGSAKKLEWKCSQGHLWTSSVTNRSRGTGCPVCRNQKTLSGFNDLATTHPELAKEAHGWDPKKVVAGTKKKLEWKCSEGHLWVTSGHSRTANHGCPYCAKTKLLTGFNDLATTHPELAKEAHGWDPTSVIAGTHKKLEWKCSEGHLWKEPGKSRVRRKNCPICTNIQVLKNFNDLSTTHPELAKQAHGWDPKTLVAGSGKRLEWKCSEGHLWTSSVANRTQGNNCPFCGNQQILKGFNDLSTTHPELAKQAHGWDPTSVIAGTHKKLEWKCSEGHLWVTSGHSRTANSGCPVCSNFQVLKGFNDLATTHPALAKEAHGWDPSSVIAGSVKKFQWKCSEGHVWKASGHNRSRGRNCPSCSSSGFDPNENGYLYFLIQPIWEIYQIGITNSPEDRLERHKKNGFQVLDLRGPIDGHTAQELETAMLRFLKSQKADLSPEHVAGKFDGYSESWTIDSYQVNNLKELIDKASEAGF